MQQDLHNQQTALCERMTSVEVSIEAHYTLIIIISSGKELRSYLFNENKEN